MRDDLRIDAMITDLALCIAEGSKGFCFPGPAQIPPEFRDYCGALVQRCTEKRREHAGKTTTASATVRSRLEAFAGMAYTVEDPPEHPLNAWQRGQGGGLGYCAQTLVGPDMDSVDGWSASMIGALRSQPARTPSILFGGEIRNVRAAEVAIQAAVNGFLVIATGFATDIPSGLDALLKMLGHARARALGALLRIVLYQRLIGDVLQALIKVLPRPNSRVATAIAGGELLRLSDEVQMQANLVRAGSDLCKATGATA